MQTQKPMKPASGLSADASNSQLQITLQVLTCKVYILTETTQMCPLELPQHILSSFIAKLESWDWKKEKNV